MWLFNYARLGYAYLTQGRIRFLSIGGNSPTMMRSTLSEVGFVSASLPFARAKVDRLETTTAISTNFAAKFFIIVISFF